MLHLKIILALRNMCDDVVPQDGPNVWENVNDEVETLEDLPTNKLVILSTQDKPAQKEPASKGAKVTVIPPPSPICLLKRMLAEQMILAYEHVVLCRKVFETKIEGTKSSLKKSIDVATMHKKRFSEVKAKLLKLKSKYT